jgi:hypothetical protein
MKKRLRPGLEQLEARETPDVSLGRSAALAVPLPGQIGINPPQQLAFLPVSGQVQQLPVALPCSGTDQTANFSPGAFHAQILESLFRDSKELDRLFGQSLDSPASATDAAPSDGTADVSDFSGLEAATLGLKFFSNYARKSIRNEELKYGRLTDHEDLFNQIYLEWRVQVGNNGQALGNLLNKDSAERQALRKTVRRVLDHERYDQQRQQRMVELLDQPAPVQAGGQEWVDLQLDWSQGVGNLSPLERQILDLRRQGMTFEEIGDDTGLVKQRVFEIFNAALERLQEVYSS